MFVAEGLAIVLLASFCGACIGMALAFMTAAAMELSR
jgi:hypothetical protein